MTGKSSVRRTCTLTMFVADDSYAGITSLNNIISLNKKVKLEIGLKNNIKDDSKNAIWGYYYNNNFYNDSGHITKLAKKINQYYKDIPTEKLYYYNGQSFVIYNDYEDYPIIWYPQGIFIVTASNSNHGINGTTINISLKDKMCLLNGEFGGVIPASTQLDHYDTINENGKWVIEKPTIYQIIQELVNHFGKEDLSKIIIEDIDTKIKMVMKWTNPDKILYLARQPITSGNPLADNERISYNYFMTIEESEVKNRPEIEIIKECKYQDDIGYIYTDFTYPEDLVADAGSSVCAQLDKIKNLLGNFEYFYDVEGNFHFREIKNYLNNTQAKIELDNMNNDSYLIDIAQGKAVYSFDNSLITTSYQNTPQYQNIKNDFVVWGIRKNANGNDIPIRYHLSIDNKPKVIGKHNNKDYYLKTKGVILPDLETGLTTVAKVPIIFENLQELKSVKGVDNTLYMTLNDNQCYIWNSALEDYEETATPQDWQDIYAYDWRTALYLQGAIAEPLGTYSNYYYTELINEWPKLYDLNENDFKSEVKERPSDIDFFLDFIDGSTSVGELNISNIGRRTVVVNDNNINCVFRPDIPEYILIEAGQPDTAQKRQEAELRRQNILQVPSSIYKWFAVGGSLNSAYEKVRELLYTYTSYNESITIQSIPIFYLEPNTRINVRDTESDIYGDYVISTISIPLAINGTMSISATRALERF